MPLLAKFIGSLAAGLVAVFSQIMAYRMALKLASYTTWITVLSAFLVSVLVCLNSLWSVVSSIFGTSCFDFISCSPLQFLGMGIGMFIPANAVTVASCLASVWFATSLYKIQRDGIHNYGS